MENTHKPTLEFYGGPIVSFLPFIIFLILIISFTFGFGAISDGALWVPAFLGLLVAFFFAKDKGYYGEVIVEGIARKDSIMPIIAWFWAGVFSRILRESGLAISIAGMATNLGISNTAFLVVTFLATAVFATASGTGFGTIAAGMGVLYPAGIPLGCDPALLAGVIISGSAFGDNLAPVSDTTICSATTQGVDVPGVVKSRVKYALTAGVLAIIGIIILGSMRNTESVSAAGLEYDKNLLFMFIPVIITIYIAIKTGDIIIATSIGIVLACITGMLIGTFELVHIQPTGKETAIPLIRIHGEGLDTTLDGLLYDGLASMLQVVVLALLLFGSIEIMRRGKGTDLVLNSLSKIIRGPRSAEFVISFMVVILSALMGLNAPAILTIGPSFGRPMAEKYGISPYRMANILDAQSNALVYALPWTPAIIYTVSFAQDTYPLSPTQVGPMAVYCWTLMLVMVVAIITGIGRNDDGKTIF